jgi:hypothetical protein
MRSRTGGRREGDERVRDVGREIPCPEIGPELRTSAAHAGDKHAEVEQEVVERPVDRAGARHARVDLLVQVEGRQLLPIEDDAPASAIAPDDFDARDQGVSA